MPTSAFTSFFARCEMHSFQKINWSMHELPLFLIKPVREVNVGAYERLELLSANGGRFEKNQLLLVDDTPLVAESEKLCRLVMSLVEYAKEQSRE